MSKFNFMTPASTAATGFSFGANKPATPGFGLGASPSGGGLTFGNQPSSAPSFGTPSTAAPSYGASFGAPVTSAPAFGTNFGSPATATPAFGSNFGAPGTSAPAFGTNFGAPTTSAPAFGTNFGAPATSAPAFNTPGFGFGTATTSAPSTGLSFGGGSLVPSGGLNFGAPTAAPTAGGLGGGLGGFNFGGAPTTTTAASGGLNFSFGAGLTSAANTQPGFGGGLSFGKPTTTQADLNKPTTAASLGLGGVDSAGLGAAGGGARGAAAGQAPAPRQAPLPAELLASVEAFQASVRQRKQLSSDIARHSIRPLHKVNSDADSLLQDTTELKAKLVEKRRSANILRGRAASALSAAERAHRTAEAPHGVEYESGEAIAWISGMVSEAESRLRLLRKQLEAAQKQLEASPRPITDQGLALGMRRIYESFVAVAGRLQAVHQQVEAQKAQYLSLRRNVLKDPTDVFAEEGSAPGPPSLDWLSRTSSGAPPPSAVISDPLAALGLGGNQAKANSLGPTPFSLLGPSGFGGLSFPNKPPVTASNTLGNTSSWSFSSPPPGLGNTAALGQPAFGQPALGQSALGQANLSWLGGADQSPFALQKPPAGNKRGKH